MLQLKGHGEALDLEESREILYLREARLNFKTIFEAVPLVMGRRMVYESIFVVPRSDLQTHV